MACREEGWESPVWSSEVLNCQITTPRGVRMLILLTLEPHGGFIDCSDGQSVPYDLHLRGVDSVGQRSELW